MDKPGDHTRRARDMWRQRGGKRPAFAIEPGPGQESVWDYPRPPVIVPDSRHVRVMTNGLTIAESSRAVRVLETASPPVFYLPPGDVLTGRLLTSRTTSFCEWKGHASYFDVRCEDQLVRDAAWCYPDPFDEFIAIAGFYAFYPGKLECRVDDERVQPQAGDFYGGWLTSEIVGPCKGDSGTGGW